MLPANGDSGIDLPIDLVEPLSAAKNSVLARENARLGALFLFDERRRDVAAAEVFGERTSHDVGNVSGKRRFGHAFQRKKPPTCV
jgi:hypothetical protein